MSHVWVLSKGMLTMPRLLVDFDAIAYEDRDNTEYESMYEMARKGELVPEQFIPQSAVSLYTDSKVNLNPEVFLISDRIAVSQKLYDAIKGFDFGGGGLHPCVPYRRGKPDKPLADAFYTLTFAGNKSAFLPEQSEPLKLDYFAESDIYSLMDVADYDIVVSRAALEGPDVWIGPKVISKIFMSGPLGDAIKAAKPRGRLPMHKCRVQNFVVKENAA